MELAAYEEVPLYVCDPDKAITCKKTNCNAVLGTTEYCSCTWNPFYAKLDEHGKPIVKRIVKHPRKGAAPMRAWIKLLKYRRSWYHDPGRRSCFCVCRSETLCFGRKRIGHAMP